MGDFQKNELCVICSHGKQSLMFLFCGHVFCEQCLSGHKSFQERSCCPICGTPRDGRRYTLKRKAPAAFNEDSPSSLSLSSQTSFEQTEGYVSDEESNTFGSEYSYDGSAFAISISSIENELDELDPSHNYYYDNHYRECGMDCIECNDDE
uniref:RING-type domain-containing protein n=1 Tax=Glossina pallidipes TaxID=7398 RepID=A0A1A9ZL11_GLOPL